MTALTPHGTGIWRLIRSLGWSLCGPTDPDPRGALPWWGWLSH